MDYERLAEIANGNESLNFGRRFTPESVEEYFAVLEVAKQFEQDGKLYGLISVTKDGELGFVLDSKYVRTAYAPMVDFLNSIRRELWCNVQKNNLSILRVLEENGFRVVREFVESVTLGRAAWGIDEPTKANT